MSRLRKTQLPAVTLPTDNGLVPVGTTASTPVPGTTLEEWNKPLTTLEETFAKLFVQCCNATKAYIEATGYEGPRHLARIYAWEMSNKPHIRRRVREYESIAAAATVIDYAAIL